MAKSNYIILFIMIFFFLFIAVSSQYSIADIRTSSVSSQDYLRVSLGISENYRNVRALYYIDINNDKFVDIISSCKEDNIERICFFLYNPKTGNFDFQSVHGLAYENSEILNLIANDFNGDSYMDMLVTYKKNDGNQTISDILLYDPVTKIYKNDYKFSNAKEGIFIADLGETRGVDMLYFDTELNTRKFLYYNDNSIPAIKSFDDIISSNTEICDRSHLHSTYPLLSPHSSSFVDIDGDCVNDMIIMSYSEEKLNEPNENANENAKTQVKKRKYLEIWRGVIENNKVKYCLTQSSVYELDLSFGLFSLVDVDRDALLDIVFPIMNTSPPKILIAFNQIQLTYDWTKDYCATHQPLTLQYGADKSKIQIPLVFEEFKIDKNTPNMQTITLLESDKKSFYECETHPAFLRFNDINIDSYQDFTCVIYDKSEQSKYPYVFLNSPVSYEANYTGPIRRTFTKNNVQILPVKSAIYSTFFDLDENGKLDLIVQYEDVGNSVAIAGFWNNYVYDAYYIKSLLLNQPKSFFSNELGASSRFITTNIDGSRRMDYAVQASQINTRNALIVPYAYFGIGRSNNYIENFHAISGNYLQSSDNYKIFTPIIPNSQLIIHHTPVYTTATNQTSSNDTNATVTQDSTSTLESTNWSLDLIVQPTSKLSLLITMIVILLIILSVVVVYYHIKEKEEDSIENQQLFAPWFG